MWAFLSVRMTTWVIATYWQHVKLTSKANTKILIDLKLVYKVSYNEQQ